MNQNFIKWKNGISKYCGGDEKAETLINVLGGEQKICNATFASTADSGCAGNGMFLEQVLRLVRLGISINDLLPEERRADKESLIRVLLLSHIAKVGMFEEIPMFRGNKLYDFVKEKKTALRTGEKSTFLCMAAGISISEEEWEAMRIIDLPDDDAMARLYSTQLSNVVRVANLMADMSVNKRTNS